MDGPFHQSASDVDAVLVLSSADAFRRIAFVHRSSTNRLSVAAFVGWLRETFYLMRAFTTLSAVNAESSPL